MRMTKAMKEVLSDFERGNLVSGKRWRTINSLKNAGLVANVTVHPKYDPVRGYPIEFYSGDVLKKDD